ncbi:MAG: hypothetical protein M1813_003172 [Trichoglossum hirsutum]|nr:MAG: hypothetical protein M1813_003172 [Trichoglossum hirsutum]
MKVLQWGLVLLVGVRATPFPGHLVYHSRLARLHKRAVIDATCDRQYGSFTARSLIVSNMDLTPAMAQAGSGALGKVVQSLQKDPPTWGPGEQDRILKMYTTFFGNPKGSAGDHISRIGLIRSGLSNLAATSSSSPPDIIIHCDDSWLTENALEGAPPRPDGGDPNKIWFYDIDRTEWT